MALTYVSFALFLIAHLAGLVAAIILLTRIKGTPAILATVAFGLLFVQDIGVIMRTAFLNRLIFQRMAFRTLPWAQGGLDCCCGLFDLIAVVCLIVALWQAISATSAEKAAEGAEATWEEAENIE